jgi:predicted RNA-binding Zn ribbon-like protein
MTLEKAIEIVNTTNRPSNVPLVVLVVCEECTKRFAQHPQSRNRNQLWSNKALCNACHRLERAAKRRVDRALK